MAKSLAALEKLVACLCRLPGVGRRSAERMAIRLVLDRNSLGKDMVTALREAGEKISCCSRCGGLTDAGGDPCRLCEDASRDDSLLCVVESPSDILLIENAGGYRGRYHVLAAKLSPMNRQGASDMRLDSLMKRLDGGLVKEVILALNSDVESEATASFVRDMLGGLGVRISRPAMGLPAGGALAYSDPLTLARAISGREALNVETKEDNR